MSFSVKRKSNHGAVIYSTFYNASSNNGCGDVEHVIVHLKDRWGQDRVWLYRSSDLRYFDRPLKDYDIAQFFLETCLRWLLIDNDYSTMFIDEWSITDKELLKFRMINDEENNGTYTNYKKEYEPDLNTINLQTKDKYV